LLTFWFFHGSFRFVVSFPAGASAWSLAVKLYDHFARTDTATKVPGEFAAFGCGIIGAGSALVSGATLGTGSGSDFCAFTLDGAFELSIGVAYGCHASARLDLPYDSDFCSDMLELWLELEEMKMTANKALEPTRVGAFSSGVAVHVHLSQVAQLDR
jgi:hypothetical protein